MQLHKEYSGRVHAISLNVDCETNSLLPNLEKEVADTLTRLNVRCDNVICTTPRDEVFGEWGIFSIPAVVVYDTHGNVRQVFDGKVDYESDIIPLVEQMLETKAFPGQSD